jgi:hypothetical protein
MLKNIVTFNTVKLRKDEAGMIYLDLELFLNQDPDKVILMYSIPASDDAMARMDDTTRQLLKNLNNVASVTL